MRVCSFREVPLNLLHTPNQQRLLVKASFIIFLSVFYLAAQDGFNIALISPCIWSSSRTGGKAGLGAGAPECPNRTYIYTRIIRIIILELHEYYDLAVVCI